MDTIRELSLPLNIEPLRTGLLKKLADAGPATGERKSVLFWTVSGEVNNTRKERIENIVLKAYKDQSSTPEHADPSHYSSYDNLTISEDDDRNLELLRSLVKSGSDVSLVRAAAERLIDLDLNWERRTITDEMTGLYTRGFCVGAIKEFLESYLTGNSDAAICFTDIDDLKLHNEQGYPVGNGVIKAVAVALRDSGEIAGRFFSGDEDIVIIPNVKSGVEADFLMETVRTQLLPKAIEDVRELNDENFRIGDKNIDFSYGYTTFREVMEYLVESGFDQSDMSYDEISDRVINTVIHIGQSMQIIEKGRKKKLPDDEIRKNLTQSLSTRNVSEYDKIVKFCLKRKGIN